MNQRILTLAVAVALFAGCGQQGPPAPLTAEELPTVVRNAFQRADAESRDRAEEAVKAFEAKNLGRAWATFQELAAQPSLTENQREVVSRAVLAANALLSDAAAQGNAEAEATIRLHMRNK